MKFIKKAARLAAINIAIFAGLLLLLNLLCFLALKTGLSHNHAEHHRIKNNQKKHELIKNDKPPAYNRLTMKEFYSIQSEYVPYVGWSKTPFEGKTTTINAEGDRVHQAPQALQEDAPVVRFFGGSTTWGVGADDQGTIPAHFNTFFPNSRVFNHGEVGFHSRQEIARLVNLINQKRELGLVIFYDGHNDIVNYCRKDVEVNEHNRKHQINESLRKSKLLDSKKFICQKFLQILFIDSIKEVVENLRGNSEGKRENSSFFKCCYDEQELEKTADKLIANWELAHKLVINHGGQFMAFLQPSAYINNHQVFERMKSYTGRPPCLLDKHEMIYQIIRTKLADKTWFVDISDVLNDYGDYYFDMVHVSSPANRAVAERMVKAIKKSALTENEDVDQQPVVSNLQ